MRPQTVQAIIDAIGESWSVETGAEITLEANPTSVEAGRFRGYRAAGVNRLSIGVQALNDADLKALGRRHSVAEALEAVKVASGIFSRTSFDLIYARPGQSEAAWRAELSEALALAGEHLSLYQLTIEPDTMFERLWKAGKLATPDADLGRALFDVTQELTEQLCKTFITPLEREDIQALAAALYKIPKTVEKIGERLLICPGDLQGRSFRKHLDLLDQAAEAVLAMVKELRKGIDAVSAREKNARLQTIEGDADKLELELLRDLYHGDYDAKHTIFLRDIYELLEKVIDRCRDAGNIVTHIVLKHS